MSAQVSQEFLAFFSSLEENNSKEWFHANKKTYQNTVRPEFIALVESLLEALSTLHAGFSNDPKKALVRINRDIRFSQDKTPYKTHMGAVLTPRGKDMSAPGFYFEIGASGAALYGGLYQPTPVAVTAVRHKIVSESERFKQAIGSSLFIEKFGELRGDEHKRLPKEFQAQSESIPELFKKQFYFFCKFPQSAVLQSLFDETVFQACLAGWELVHFLTEAVETSSSSPE